VLVARLRQGVSVREASPAAAAFFKPLNLNFQTHERASKRLRRWSPPFVPSHLVASPSRDRARDATCKRIDLGRYDTPEQAALALDTAAKQFFGEFARLNFPNEHPDILSPAQTLRQGGRKCLEKISGHSGLLFTKDFGKARA